MTSQHSSNDAHPGFKLLPPRAPACSDFIYPPLTPGPTDEARNTRQEGSIGGRSTLPPSTWRLQQGESERTGPHAPQNLGPKKN